MKLRPATPTDRIALDNAITHLKIARNDAAQSGCPKVANKIKTALKSADGAKRHMERRLMHSDAPGKVMIYAGTVMPVATP